MKSKLVIYDFRCNFVLMSSVYIYCKWYKIIIHTVFSLSNGFDFTIRFLSGKKNTLVW